MVRRFIRRIKSRLSQKVLYRCAPSIRISTAASPYTFNSTHTISDMPFPVTEKLTSDSFTSGPNTMIPMRLHSSRKKVIFVDVVLRMSEHCRHVLRRVNALSDRQSISHKGIAGKSDSYWRHKKRMLPVGPYLFQFISWVFAQCHLRWTDPSSYPALPLLLPMVLRSTSASPLEKLANFCDSNIYLLLKHTNTDVSEGIPPYQAGHKKRLVIRAFAQWSQECIRAGQGDKARSWQ